MTINFSKYSTVEMLIKFIKLVFGNGRILSGFGYIAIGWIVAKRKKTSRWNNILVGVILLVLLFFVGDTFGFLLKLAISAILLRISSEITLPQHKIWKHMRYASEIIYFTHMWMAFIYTLLFRKFRYYGLDIFIFSMLIPIIFYFVLYRSQSIDKVKKIL